MLWILVCMQMVGFVWVVLATEEESYATKDTLPNYRANSFELIPEVDDEIITSTYKDLTKPETRHQFWDKYNEKANSKEFDPGTTDGLANQLSTGVMTWDTIIVYASVIIEFISNLWLVVGAGFIIFSGYQYAMSAFGAKEDNGWAIKNAFIGIAVIATSYGIFRLLARIFIE